MSPLPQGPSKNFFKCFLIFYFCFNLVDNNKINKYNLVILLQQRIINVVYLYANSINTLPDQASKFNAGYHYCTDISSEQCCYDYTLDEAYTV